MGNSFYDRYAELCRGVDETPNSVARILGISSGSITSWKNGTEPRYTTIAKIAAYFGVSPDYLLSGLHRDKRMSYAVGVVAITAGTKEEAEKSVAELIEENYSIVYRNETTVVAVEKDSVATQEQIDAIISIYAKKAPTGKGERSVSDDDIKFALFGGDGEITDEMYDEVKRFAAYIKQREAGKK